MRNTQHVIQSGRREGRTTAAMLACPQGAVFVWCDDQLEYAKSLALKLGRHDLQIVAPQWLKDHWQGRKDAVALDHAFVPSFADREARNYLSIKGLLQCPQ